MITFSFHTTETSLKTDSPSTCQEIPRILWNPNVLWDNHWSLSWATWIQPTHSHQLNFLRPILILFSHIRLGLQNRNLPSGFLTNIFCSFETGAFCRHVPPWYIFSTSMTLSHSRFLSRIILRLGRHRVYRHWSGRARTVWTVVAWHKWIRVVWRHASWMVDQTTWPHMFTRPALVPYPGCKITLQTEGRTVVPLMTSCRGRRRMRNQRLRPFYYL